MGPGVNNSGVINYTHGLLTIDSLSIDGIGCTHILSLRVGPEVQERLGVLIGYEVLGKGRIAIGIHITEEPLVVLAGHNAYISRSIDIGKAIFAGISSIGGVEQDSGD